MPKLNPNEAPEGFIATACNNGKTCEGCERLPYFQYACNEKCSPALRQDKCWVIFKRKPVKPKRVPREWMAWATVGDWPNWNIGYNVTASRSEARQRQRNAACGAKVIRVKITEVVC